ncbi:arsenate reductase (glutaredoxin) [Halomonas sp. V046]|uniref:arsenate reductase (glutaredoxin) n=1 Tax=Halomonas sp. V046 TaxID=3459611 RepID=UPI004044564B
MKPTIYHNPDCGTSRNTLAMLKASGEEPEVIEYLQTPPTRERLVELIATMAVAPRDLLRRKDTPYDDLGLDDASLSDEALIDAMMANPLLINRPIVVSAKGACLCRPSERVLDLLDAPLSTLESEYFIKEDGEVVVVPPRAGS